MMQAKQNSLVMAINVMTNLITDVGTVHSEWFPCSSCRKTIQKVVKRYEAEGISFLTKTMPALRKCLDQALTGTRKLDCLRFRKKPGTELPMLFGEFFSRVFNKDGWVLPDPCVDSIRILRQVLDLFYKLELPYDENQKNAIIEGFTALEERISDGQRHGAPWQDPLGSNQGKACPCNCSRFYCTCWACLRVHLEPEQREFKRFNTLGRHVASGQPRYARLFMGHTPWKRWSSWDFSPFDNHQFCGICAIGRPRSSGRGNEYVAGEPSSPAPDLIASARRVLNRLLARFDPASIVPRHGPGAVSTGEKQWEKMKWKRLYKRIHDVYPFDAYYNVSYSHICDAYTGYSSLEELESGTAKVLLVPKDSRGPRLISCEPLEYQWIQQGLGRALVQYIEAHPLTRGYVNFTCQAINQKLALQGSITGEYATLDLKDASDRVSLRLVRELFPEHVLRALEATRTTHTLLPSGRVLKLNKFAPMGSCLCFPILALTCWAITTARVLREDSISNPFKVRGRVYVYGDDVIVKSSDASNTIEALESVGLRVNREKSFLQGSFRESCGVDAFKGVEVQPVRIRTPWTSSRNAGSYSSWVSYANDLHRRGYKQTALHIAGELAKTYGPIPDYRLASPYACRSSNEDTLGYPYLRFDCEQSSRVKRRWNRCLQRYQYYVWTLRVKKKILRDYDGWSELLRYLTAGSQKFEAGVYAVRRASMLARSWR